MTRGNRNNNPLNIRHGKSQWMGMCKEQTDREFVQFEHRKFGYRAAFVLLRNYIGKGHNTIGRIIGRWAPQCDGNNTQAYIEYVSQTTGIDPHQVICFGDKQTMVDIVRTMAQMESGIIEDLKVLEKAYEMVK